MGTECDEITGVAHSDSTAAMLDFDEIQLVGEVAPDPAGVGDMTDIIGPHIDVNEKRARRAQMWARFLEDEFVAATHMEGVFLQRLLRKATTAKPSGITLYSFPLLSFLMHPAFSLVVLFVVLDLVFVASMTSFALASERRLMVSFANFTVASVRNAELPPSLANIADIGLARDSCAAFPPPAQVSVSGASLAVSYPQAVETTGWYLELQGTDPGLDPTHVQVSVGHGSETIALEPTPCWYCRNVNPERGHVGARLWSLDPPRQRRERLFLSVYASWRMALFTIICCTIAAAGFTAALHSIRRGRVFTARAWLTGTFTGLTVTAAVFMAVQTAAVGWMQVVLSLRMIVLGVLLATGLSNSKVEVYYNYIMLVAGLVHLLLMHITAPDSRQQSVFYYAHELCLCLLLILSGAGITVYRTRRVALAFRKARQDKARFDEAWKRVLDEDVEHELLELLHEIRNCPSSQCKTPSQHKIQSMDAHLSHWKLADAENPMLDQIYLQARACQVMMREKLEQVAGLTDCLLPVTSRKPTPDGPDQVFVPAAKALQDPDLSGAVVWTELKPHERAIEKILHHYHGDSTRLVDICRETIVFTRLRHITMCLRLLLCDASLSVIQIKNTMHPASDASQSGGFRAVVLKIRFVDGLASNLAVAGHVCELVLVLSSIAQCVSTASCRNYRRLRAVRQLQAVKQRHWRWLVDRAQAAIARMLPSPSAAQRGDEHGALSRAGRRSGSDSIRIQRARSASDLDVSTQPARTGSAASTAQPTASTFTGTPSIRPTKAPVSARRMAALTRAPSLSSARGSGRDTATASPDPEERGTGEPNARSEHRSEQEETPVLCSPPASYIRRRSMSYQLRDRSTEAPANLLPLEKGIGPREGRKPRAAPAQLQGGRAGSPDSPSRKGGAKASPMARRALSVQLKAMPQPGSLGNSRRGSEPESKSAQQRPSERQRKGRAHADAGPHRRKSSDKTSDEGSGQAKGRRSSMSRYARLRLSTSSDEGGAVSTLSLGTLRTQSYRAPWLRLWSVRGSSKGLAHQMHGRGSLPKGDRSVSPLPRLVTAPVLDPVAALTEIKSLLRQTGLHLNQPRTTLNQAMHDFEFFLNQFRSRVQSERLQPKASSVELAFANTTAMAVLDASYPIPAALSKRFFAWLLLLLAVVHAALTGWAIWDWKYIGHHSAASFRFAVRELRDGTAQSIYNPARFGSLGLVRQGCLVPFDMDRVTPFAAGTVWSVELDEPADFTGFYFQTAHNASADKDPVVFELQASVDGGDAEWRTAGASGHAVMLDGRTVWTAQRAFPTPQRRGDPVHFEDRAGISRAVNLAAPAAIALTGFAMVAASYLRKYEVGSVLLVGGTAVVAAAKAVSAAVVTAQGLYFVFPLHWIDAAAVALATLVLWAQQGYFVLLMLTAFPFFLVLAMFEAWFVPEPFAHTLVVPLRPLAVSLVGFILYSLRWRSQSKSLRRIVQDKDTYDALWHRVTQDADEKRGLGEIAEVVTEMTSLPFPESALRQLVRQSEDDGREHSAGLGQRILSGFRTLERRTASAESQDGGVSSRTQSVETDHEALGNRHKFSLALMPKRLENFISSFATSSTRLHQLPSHAFSLSNLLGDARFRGRLGDSFRNGTELPSEAAQAQERAHAPASLMEIGGVQSARITTSPMAMAPQLDARTSLESVGSDRTRGVDRVAHMEMGGMVRSSHTTIGEMIRSSHTMALSTLSLRPPPSTASSEQARSEPSTLAARQPTERVRSGPAEVGSEQSAHTTASSPLGLAPLLEKALSSPAHLLERQPSVPNEASPQLRSSNHRQERRPSLLGGLFVGRRHRALSEERSPLAQTRQTTRRMMWEQRVRDTVPIRNLDQLYVQAAGIWPILRTKVQTWAMVAHGSFFKVVDPKEQHKGAFVRWREAEGSSLLRSCVKWPGLKAPERAVEKLMRSYKQDVSRLLDVCRQSIVLDRATDVAYCLRIIASDPEVQVLAVKNRLSASYDAWGTLGYRDVNLILRVVTEETERLNLDLHLCEVQLLLRPFAELKSDDGHKRYVMFRNARGK